MCLVANKAKYKKPLRDVMTGYKVADLKVDIETGKKTYLPVYGPNDCGDDAYTKRWKVAKGWKKAKEMVKDPNNRTVKKTTDIFHWWDRGWHAFLNKKDTYEFLQQLETSRFGDTGNYCVIKIELRGILGIGICDIGNPKDFYKSSMSATTQRMIGEV